MLTDGMSYSAAREHYIKKFHLFPHKCRLCNRKIKSPYILRKIPHMEYNERHYFCCPEHAKRYYFGERREIPPTKQDEMRDFLHAPFEKGQE